MIARKNPPSFVLVDKSTGEVVYTKRATGMGTEAINKCTLAGRARAHKTGRTYFVFLDIGGLKVGSKINVPMAYAMGITEEVGPHQNPGGIRRNVYTFNNPPSGPADTTAARELELYINNDSQLYHSQFIPIVKNLMLKRRKGVYDTNKAVTLFMYLMDAGAKKYVREFGTAGQKIDAMFNRNTRLAAAKAFRHSFETEAELGNYDRLIGPVSNPTRGERLVKTFRCACGRTLATADADSDGTQQCDCGQLYNSFGQRLKDPSQWSGARDYEDTLDNPLNRPVSNPEYRVRFTSPDMKFRHATIRAHGTRSALKKANRMADKLPPEFTAPRSMVEVDRSDVRKNAYVFNNPRQRPHNEMERGAALVGLLVTTWAPGDGVTRYRFFPADGKNRYADYHQGGALYTANGRKDAIAFIKAYGVGRSRMNPLTQAEHDRIREKDHHLIGRSQDASIKGKAYDAAYFSGAAHQSRNIREGYRGVGVQYIPNPCSNPTCTNPRHKHVRKNPLLQTILLANPQPSPAAQKRQMISLLKKEFRHFHSDINSKDAEFDIEGAIYWFANDYHGGGGSALYSILSTSKFKPGPSVRGPEGEIEKMMYDTLVQKYARNTHTRRSNPPISAQWDKMTTRQRVAVLNVVGYEGGYMANRSWKVLDPSMRKYIEDLWLDTSSRGGTTRRRPVSASANPLTRREAGRIIKSARTSIKFGEHFQAGHTRSSMAGKAFGKSQVVSQFGPRSARPAARKITERAQRMAGTVISNPGTLRLPRPGTKMTVSAALELARRIGDRGLIEQCQKALKLQKAANKDAKCVIWKTFAMGSKDKIDSVVALTHYGDSPETMYKPPKGSKKGNHMYRHTWGEKGGKKSVPLLASADGKMLLMPLEGRKVAGDWLRH